MRFALLGTDSESIALAQAAETAGHTIDWCGDVAVRHPLRATWPNEDLGDQWEALLDRNRVDAIVVGRGSTEANLRGEQVNQLIKHGVPVLTTFPLFESVLTYYEIDMARAESQAIVQHFNPLTEHSPIMDQCRDWITHGHPQLRAIEQVVWQRPLAERTQERVLWHFARDIELLNIVAGRLHRLGALGSPDESATYAGLSVQLLGETQVPVRWQVGPVEQRAGAELQLIGARGTLTVTLSDTNRADQLSINHQGESEIISLHPASASAAPSVADVASQAVRRFVDRIDSGGPDVSTWPQALHAMELTDTIEISLRRGRMIEVHQQQLTEELAFKGTMSALGCGLLLVVPPLFLLAGWLAELVGLPFARYWPHLLLTCLALFLGLQLIPKLVFENSEKDSSDLPD